MSWELSSFLPLASCRSPSETDLLPTVDPGGCWRCCCFFCCWVVFVCVVLFFSVFFNNRSTLNFFFVLMHCEARESFSRPMRSGMYAIDGIVDWMVFCMAGKKTRIYEIYVECIWRTSPEMHIISEYWWRWKRLGRWRGSINWGQLDPTYLLSWKSVS